MKAVMISIRPEWCEKIARGKKTVEVRKTKPKLETPFKCYIYCTKPSKRAQTICGAQVINTDELYRLPNGEIKHGYSGELMCYPSEQWNKNNFLNGKVIGEFVCDFFDEFTPTKNGVRFKRFLALYESAISLKEIREYLCGKQGYGWHITNFVIYDKPKKLSDFQKVCDHKEDCGSCRRFNKSKYDCIAGLTRPPQSWFYVNAL